MPPQAPAAHRPIKKSRRTRGFWPKLLWGCFGSIVILTALAAVVTIRYLATFQPGTTAPGIIKNVITPPSVHTDQSTQTLESTGLGAIEIHNQIGKTIIASDANATTITLQITKRVKTNNQDQANQKFKRFTVNSHREANKLVISAQTPTRNPTNINDSEDNLTLDLKLPTALAQSTNGQPFSLTSTVSVGSTSLSNVSGLLNIQTDIGDVMVQGSKISNGSRLVAGNGNVSFQGSLDLATPSPSAIPSPSTNPIPTATASSGSITTTPRYTLKCEVGNLDITLPSDTQVKIDTETNNGQIHSDFPIQLTQEGNDYNYYGPLQPGAAPTTVLVARVSTGNVALHKAAL